MEVMLSLANSSTTSDLWSNTGPTRLGIEKLYALLKGAILVIAINIVTWISLLYDPYTLSKSTFVNSLWPSDAIRRQGPESTLAQVMACCLTAPGHYLNQCWLIIIKVLWHSSEGIIMRRSEDTNQTYPNIFPFSAILTHGNTKSPRLSN